jgi:hypothetical protein
VRLALRSQQIVLGYPRGHRRGPDAAVLSDEVDDAPASIALLNMDEGEGCDFGSTQAAAQKNSEDGAIAETSNRRDVGRTQEGLRLPLRQPVPDADAGRLHALDPGDSGRQFRRQQNIKCGQPPPRERTKGPKMAQIEKALGRIPKNGVHRDASSRFATSNPGFVAQGVLAQKVAPSSRDYPDQAKRAAFYARILENARAIPGVDAAAVGGGLPLIGTAGAAGVAFEGRPQPRLGLRSRWPASVPAIFKPCRSLCSVDACSPNPTASPRRWPQL